MTQQQLRQETIKIRHILEQHIESHMPELRE